MSQEHFAKEDQIEQFWAIHGRRNQPVQTAFDWYEQRDTSRDPWCNGRIALAAIVWGLIAMLLLSLPVQASGTAKKKPHPGTKVEAFVKVAPKLKCLEPVRVVGSQDIREDAAEESARKAWAEIVRWDSGEAFMNIENATGYKRRCGRSSIGEALGQVLNRCEITAAPCRPEMVERSK